MDVDPIVSKSEIGHFQLGKGPSRGFLRDCEIFVNLWITFVWSWITNCHLHSCLRPWCGLEERIWWNHEYEFEESRSRQTLLTGLDRDRQLAHSHLRYNTDFFLRCAVYQPPWCAAPGHGSGEVRQLCVQSLVAYLLGPSWTKFKKGGRDVFNIEFRWQ